MRWTQLSAAIVDTKFGIAKRRRKKTLPYFTVTFAPPAVVTNLLPLPLYLKVGHRDDNVSSITSRARVEERNLPSEKSSSDELVIEPSASLYLYSKPRCESTGLKVALSMDRRRWSQFVPVQESVELQKKQRRTRKGPSKS